MQAFFLEEGVAAVLDRGSDLSLVGGAPLGSGLVWPTQRTDGGTLFVGPGGSRATGAREVVPAATIAVEHYNRMIRVLDKGLPVTVEIDIRTRFHDETRPNGFNLLGELPGTDLADEVVILGAHFDSTHASPGATDNAAGVAAMMEAARILQVVDARPAGAPSGWPSGAARKKDCWARAPTSGVITRTPRTMNLLPDHAEVSAYYNLDNGAGPHPGHLAAGATRRLRPCSGTGCAI